MSDRPTLSSWMTGTSHGHPLRLFAAEPDAGSEVILDAFEDLIAPLEALAPLRWEGKRRTFRSLRADHEFLELRAELVIAAKLTRASAGFEFGDTSTLNPDFVLASGLGIEVTSRAPAGIEGLYEALENALGVTPSASVHLTFDPYPVRIKSEEAEALARDVLEVARLAETTRSGGVVERVVRDPANGVEVGLQAQVLPVPSLGSGVRITWETVSADLTAPMAAVESQLALVLQDERKLRQASVMPCLLAVDIARLGSGWMRPPGVWAGRLAQLIPDDWPFIGLAVFAPSLHTSDCDFALALAPGLRLQHAELLHRLARTLGLSSAQVGNG